ncbi:hypothetical protein BCR32DRAFT_266489 [Anaeromyces robustus]|uniref:Uncharacterized protein n=1 Tax=Anaeromyces robustus TaxID=1754192 RepID=A0A1Y1XEQ8_9FUNG|nr:hypothetical protein BCR32DRAFT_266489 [Anaeromyces robustus]|eukprot:ORX84172.1 hypothetical protein BCR32DRAFT_266489 [Anaeromyces robustus]
MGSQYTELESQNTKYGSFEESKPLQNTYNTSFPTVKYESLNEIHLDFSKAKHFKINGNRNDENVTSEPLTTSPKHSSMNLKENLLEKLPINHKDYFNSIRTNSNSTTNSSTTYVPSFHHSNTFNNGEENNNNNNQIVDNNENNNINIKEKIKKKSSPNVYIDTKLKNSINTSFNSSANTTFTVPNNNINSSETPSTEATLDSPFTFRNFENTPTSATSTNLTTPTPTSETPKTSNTSTPTSNFKSFKSFDRLKDQLEKAARQHSTFVLNESKPDLEQTREQIIHNQFSEQFKDAFTFNSSPFKNKISISNEKEDPFNPFNNTNFTPPQEIVNNPGNDDPFLPSNNHNYQINEGQPSNFESIHDMNNKLKINWTIQTDSEKYISRLESKISKIKKTPKEIVVQIPEYDYTSLDEETDILSDTDSINQPLISRSEAGTRVRRRKQIMNVLRDNKKLFISLLLILLLLAIASKLYFF